MDRNTIEIRDDEIEVEGIIRKIRDNIRHRHSTEESCTGPEIIQTSHLLAGSNKEFNELLQRDLSLLRSVGDLRNNNYFISSHHPYLGKFLVKGRQLVHGEVRRYVDPILFQQNKFNLIDIRILTELLQKNEEMECQILLQKEEFDRTISQQKEELKTTVIDEIDCHLRAVFSQIDSDLHSRIKLAHILEERIAYGIEQETKSEVKYHLFEDRFRGSREDIKLRQLEFLHYFEKCSRVLDIGCGRGEFLEILRDHNIGGLGVELDADLKDYCEARKLYVEHSDAVSYLENLEDNSLDGIFIDQVVEHLEPAYLVRLLGLCYQKLKSGFYIVIETVNPLSFVSFVNFYIDMTHTKPVHPETLKFLLGSVGFQEIETKVSAPVPSELRLKKIPDAAKIDETSKLYRAIYNENIEKLNNILFGDQDYAVIAKKG